MNRKDAETPRKKKNASVHLPLFSSYPVFPFFLALCLCVSAVITSCSSKPVDLRTLAPADALVYLETNDLGKTVQTLTEAGSFKRLAKTTPDLSALKGIQLAVVVTGFEISEEKASEEDHALSFRPRFVAIAETHAWNYQALAFTENKLGEFINQTYGGEVEQESVDKNDGRFFTWTATDGRKAYALVQGGRIFFGNDESAIEKCLSVKRGEADSFAKTAKLSQPGEGTLVAGHVSTDGVAQIATLAGTLLGNRSGGEEDVQKFISEVLPPILRNTVKEVTWTSAKTEQGIEDRVSFAADAEVSVVWKETLIGSKAAREPLAEFLPSNPISVTRYDLNDPRIAWRSVLLLAAKQTDEVRGPILVAFSGSLFDPYGVADGEMFLGAVGPQILTAKFDAEGEKTAVVVTVKDAEKIKKAIAGEIDFSKPPEKQGSADIWKSADGDLIAAFVENKLVLGDAESVMQCLAAKENGANFTQNALFSPFSESGAIAVTVASDNESAGKIVDVLNDRKTENENAATAWTTETRFNEKGIERRTVSEFGLIGDIVEHLAKE